MTASILGRKVDFKCESCGTFPTWGMACGKWWLTCDCWQTDTGIQDEVILEWKADRQKRINHSGRRAR